MKIWHPVSVQTYSGYRLDESPRTFLWEGLEYVVASVLRSTYEQSSDRKPIRRFFVLTTTDEPWTLIQDVESTGWYIET